MIPVSFQDSRIWLEIIPVDIIRSMRTHCLGTAVGGFIIVSFILHLEPYVR